MTCEHSEYVANVAKFERLLTIFIRKHIRQHIFPSVRVALGGMAYFSDSWVILSKVTPLVQCAIGNSSLNLIREKPKPRPYSNN